ncbi:PH domain-like protein [Gloeophyllum trabeum ATCC 11539]|uniref:PH domain-like protein n=1 Tax=Gloeophyllum trabeum (strain ATCC 11539 / FP-39264 / Madison 617) TaxID=670483 RepID=S7PWG3_GLOTA|nr:PH domain-like protein [Gloeophyllum trabeum ATCC 11539]EPQ51863.1 PH domain-like protein [Gloeophyllum trabeum ATCC 11539]
MSPRYQGLEHHLAAALPSASYEIICTVDGRLYHAAFASARKPAQWAPSGLQGMLVFGRDRCPDGGYWFRLIDPEVRTKSKVVWAYSIQKGMKYEKDKPFFHSFAGASRQYGFRFDDDEEADVFFDTVTKTLAPPKPVTPKKRRSLLGARRASAPLVVSAPAQGSFTHLAHISIDEKGFLEASESVNPEWLLVLERSET